MNTTKSSRTYVSTTRLAKASGLAVAALRRILAQKRYLDLGQPTEKALRSGLAKWMPVDANSRFPRPEPSVYVVWDSERMSRILRRSGVVQDPRFHTRSVHNGADNVEEIAKELALHVGADPDGDRYDDAERLEGRLGDVVAPLVNDSLHLGIGFIHHAYAAQGGGAPGPFLFDDWSVLFDKIEAETGPGKHLEAARSIWAGMADFVARQASRAPRS